MLARDGQTALKQPASGANRASAGNCPGKGPTTQAELTSSGAALEAPALTLGQATPDAKPFVIGQRVLEAFGLDGARLADTLGRAGRASLLWEEAVGVLIQPGGRLVPGLDPDGVGAH